MVALPGVELGLASAVLVGSGISSGFVEVLATRQPPPEFIARGLELFFL